MRVVRSSRGRWALAALAVAAVVVLAAGYVVAARDEPATFIGTDMGGDAAPDFRLTNQFGQPVALNEQRGKIVVLTFLYTHCPDVCPLTAARLSRVYERLGADAARVAFLAVSVDPEQDTPESVRAFSQRFGMLDRWSFLIGSRAELEPVWQAYHVGVLEDHEHGTITHNAPIYLIDRDGKWRILHTTGGETDVIIDEVLHDIRLLLDE